MTDVAPEQAVLDAVNRGAITMPQIAKATGFTPGEVADCVRDLIRAKRLAGASSLMNCAAGCSNCALACAAGGCNRLG